MGRYLIKASYTAEGAKGLLKDGGTARRNSLEKTIQALNGTLESFDFAFGADDVYVVVQLPNNETAAAVSLTVGASGAVRCDTVVLLSPEEIDRAAHQTIDYRPPGK